MPELFRIPVMSFLVRIVLVMWTTIIFASIKRHVVSMHNNQLRVLVCVSNYQLLLKVVNCSSSHNTSCARLFPRTYRITFFYCVKWSSESLTYMSYYLLKAISLLYNLHCTLLLSIHISGLSFNIAKHCEILCQRRVYTRSIRYPDGQ